MYKTMIHSIIRGLSRSFCQPILFCLFLPLLWSAFAFSAELELLTPDDGAVYDPISPIEHEFLANPEQRSQRPARLEDSIRQYEKQWAEYEETVRRYKAEGRNWKELKRPRDNYNFYENNEWSKALLREYAKEGEEYRPFTWKQIGEWKPNADITVLFSESSDFSAALRVYPRTDKRGRSIDGIRPDNLKLGVLYYWKVVLTDKDSEISSDVRTFRTLDVPPRLLRSPTITNIRDLGGGTNAYGKHVRQGLLFRSGAVVPLKYCQVNRTTADQEYQYFFRDILNLKTEIDLRSNHEFKSRCQQWGEEPLSRWGVRRENYPITGYHLNIPDNKPLLCALLSRLADPTIYPVLFHCAGGADRTGTLGVLLDGILGREYAVILNNYEVTSLSGHARYRYSRKAAQMFDELQKYAPQAPLREQVERYLLGLGVPAKDIESIRRILLE